MLNKKGNKLRKAKRIVVKIGTNTLSTKDGKMAFSLRMQRKNNLDSRLWNIVNFEGEDFVITDDCVGYSFENSELVNRLFGEDDRDEESY